MPTPAPQAGPAALPCFAPPPEPPLPAASGVSLRPLPYPPPADVIELKVEFTPTVPSALFGDASGPPAPPPPTEIGKVAAVIVKPESAAANGLAV